MIHKKSSNLSYLAGCLFILAFLAAALYPSVFLGQDTFVRRDIFRYYYPVWKFCVESLRAGVLPLWNPYVGYGAPQLANVQSCVFYPFSILFYLFDFIRGFNLFIFIHLLLAGFLTICWMRECGASYPAALLSGGALMLGGYTLSVINLSISLSTLTYLPAALLCVKKMLTSGGKKWCFGAILSLAMQFLAGDPSIFYSTVVVLILAVMAKSIEDASKHALFPTQHITKLFIILAAAAGLTAFQGIPFFELLVFSNRTAPEADNRFMWSFQWPDFFSIAIPHFSDATQFFQEYSDRQSWLENPYVGASTLVLAALALRRRWTDKIVRWHLWLFVFGLVLSFGEGGVLSSVLSRFVPFFEYIRYPARFFYIAGFAAACLGGFGVDAVLRRQEPLNKTFQWKSFAAVLFSCIVLFFISPSLKNVLDRMMPMLLDWLSYNSSGEWTVEKAGDLILPIVVNLRRSLLAGLLVFLGVRAFESGRLSKKLAAVFFITLIFSDLFETNRVEPAVHRSWLTMKTPAVERVLSDRSGLFRVTETLGEGEAPENPDLFWGMVSMYESFSANLMLPHKIFNAGSYDSIYIHDSIFLTTLSMLNPARSEVMADVSNVKYMYVSKPEEAGRWNILQKAGAGYLCENTTYLPRFRLVSKALVADNKRSVLNGLFVPQFDLRSMMLLEKGPPDEWPGKDQELSGNDSVEVLGYSLNEIKLGVFSTKKQWLIASEAYYPGWKAWVNDKPASIHKANYCFRTLQVPPGQSVIRWKYDPFSFRAGLWVSLATASVLLGLGSAATRKKFFKSEARS